MILKGENADIQWQPAWADAMSPMGHGTRCTLGIEVETEDVLRMDASGTARYWRDKIVTGAAWSGTADTLCTQAEADALLRQSLLQAAGGDAVMLRVVIGGTAVAGTVYLDSVEVGGDMDGALEVTVSFTGCGVPSVPSGAGGVFDITFDTTFN